MHKRIITSVMSLFFQSGYSAFLGLAANLVLTILLTPAIFGMYITVLSIISLLNYFSDIGLAASLKQKIAKPSEKLLKYQTPILTPTIVGLASLINPLVDTTPRYNKWAPALPF